MIFGEGSPEGREKAPYGELYWDRLNKSQWIKESTDENDPTGWFQQIGESVE
jgi:hypothetical protein